MIKPIILTVTAHPDDEVLGFGATSYVLSQKGATIFNLILSGEAKARHNRPEDEDLKIHATRAQEIIGAQPPLLGSFPNIKFNMIPHLELVKFIEEKIQELEPDYIFTHHPGDLNNDHYHTSIACQSAVRLFQRKILKPVTGFYFMEILSSTDWAFPTDGNIFKPNTFIEIGKKGLSQKIESLSAYKGVMRDYPHPRSVESISSLAKYRGSQAGIFYAEAFQAVFQRNIIQIV